MCKVMNCKTYAKYLHVCLFKWMAEKNFKPSTTPKLTNFPTNNMQSSLGPLEFLDFSCITLQLRAHKGIIFEIPYSLEQKHFLINNMGCQKIKIARMS